MEHLEFTLQQHTPMLHFQASQERATLRASDVKPRFDRWLIKKVWKDNFDECCSYLVGYSDKFSEEQRDNFRQKFDDGYRALNYKMRIVPSGRQTVERIVRERTRDGRVLLDSMTPMYFGYDDKKPEDHNLKAVSYDEVRLTLVFTGTAASGLRDNIRSYIGLFFMTHNFGTRATKGYGSFTVKDDRPEPTRLKYTFEGNSWYKLMEDIDIFYKTMRGGINWPHKNLYFKSLMFAYAKSKGKRWDKKTIKENLLNMTEINRQKNDHDDPDILTYREGADDIYDFRDALGLSTDEKWDYYGVKISKNNDSIPRFASPILFKPVRTDGVWTIYIVWTELPQNIYDKTIPVRVMVDNQEKAAEKVQGRYGKTYEDLVTLKIPRDLTITDYMDFLFKRNPAGSYSVDPEEYYVKGDAATKNRIMSIYKAIRENFNRP